MKESVQGPRNKNTLILPQTETGNAEMGHKQYLTIGGMTIAY